MQLSTNDWIGFIGVTILLSAFLLNIFNRISRDGLLYIIMNIAGAGLACLASYLIHYMPFVILEGAWMLVSLWALIRLNISKDRSNQ